MLVASYLVSGLLAQVVSADVCKGTMDLASHCDEDSAAVSLLQTGLRLRESKQRSWPEPQAFSSDVSIRPDRFVDMPDSYANPGFSDRWALYGLNGRAADQRTDGMFEVAHREDGKCYMTVPFLLDEFPKGAYTDGESMHRRYVFRAEPTYNGFAFGECPRVLPLVSKKRLRHLGSNPTIVALPAKLKAKFPAGRWLATSNMPSGFVRADGSKALASPVSQIHILDDGYESIEVANVRWTGISGLTAELLAVFGYLSDMRLHLMQDDTIAIGFMDYQFQGTKYAPEPPDTWFFHELFGKLHVDTNDIGNETRLDVWLDRSEVRSLAQCDQGVPKWDANHVHKNMGFAQEPGGGDLYLLSWVHPPQVGKLNLSAAPVSNGSIFGYSCFVPDPSKPMQNPSIFGVDPPLKPGEKSEWALNGMVDRYNSPSNGPPLIWLTETKEFLGMGHFHRGYGDSVYNNLTYQMEAGKFGHHYTQFWFTYNMKPPFRITRMSPEFCFQSDQDSEDCDSIQFVTGMQRVGESDTITISYGVSDFYGYVATVNVSTVVNSLRPVS